MRRLIREHDLKILAYIQALPAKCYRMTMGSGMWEISTHHHKELAMVPCMLLKKDTDDSSERRALISGLIAEGLFTSVFLTSLVGGQRIKTSETVN